MTREKVRGFIFEKFPIAKSKDIRDESRLLEEGIIDSLGVLELVDFLQNELGVQVDDEELVPDNFESIDAIVGFAESKS